MSLQVWADLPDKPHVSVICFATYKRQVLVESLLGAWCRVLSENVIYEHFTVVISGFLSDLLKLLS